MTAFTTRLRVMQPKSVLVYGGHLLPRVRRDYGTLLETSSRDRILVVWGDQLLSTLVNEAKDNWQEDIAWLWAQFRRVAFQAKDLPVPYIYTAPVGLDEMYMRGQIWRTADMAMRAASLEGKQRNVLATRGLHVTLDDFRTLPPSYSAVVASRETSVKWAQSQEASGLVDYRVVPASQWWHELSTYRFLLAPHGLAVQTSKTIGALMVLTVPIVQKANAHEDLQKMGFPILMVDAWDNITSELLRVAWNILSPRLQSFRAKCLTAESYWRFYTGELGICF